MRNDLLALGDDDLAGMTNLGTVRRARREVEDGQVSLQLSETADGTVTTSWSDGPVCTIQGGATLAGGRCTCPAVGTICRHLLRTVIAYQRGNQASAPSGPWDPGTITDAALELALGRPVLEAARRGLDEGLVAEVVRSRKPVVRFIGSDLAVRFLVPHDLRYVAADMEGVERDRLAAMAVLAFRQLAPGRMAGVVVSGGQSADPAQAVQAGYAVAWADQVLLLGAAGVPSAVLDHGRGLEEGLRRHGLFAIAELVAAIGSDLAQYRAQDALFAPERLAEGLGELHIRCDVIARPVQDLPLPLVRGIAPGRLGERDAGRFIGLGCAGRVLRRSLVLTSLVQDMDTGSLAAVVREHADPAEGDPRAAHLLAGQAFAAGVSLHAIAHGTLQSPSCRREAGGRLVLGRGRHAVTPQGFAWERLRDPVLVEDFAELRARLSALPPPCLRARSLCGDVHVLRVHEAGPAAFDPVTQTWRWRIQDAEGGVCDVEQTYQLRIAPGCAALAAALQGGRRQLFVAAEIRLRAGQLVGVPLSVVFEDPAGRVAIMPWCDDAAPGTGPAAASLPSVRTGALVELEALLCDVVVDGIERAGTMWGRLLPGRAQALDAGGYPRLAAKVMELHAVLAQRGERADWHPESALPLVQELAQWHRLALDTAG